MHRSRFLLALAMITLSISVPDRATADDDAQTAAQTATQTSAAAPVRVVRGERPVPTSQQAERWAQQVTITRDSYGVPHIDGKTDESVVFGFAYAQAEDFFWQIEDSYILSMGRYSEVHGGRALNSDLLNRAFEVVKRSKEGYQQLDPDMRTLCDAFVAGLNFYLDTHPEVEPRMIKRFEPWQVLAFQNHMTLELCYRYTRLSTSFMPLQNKRIWAAMGSNGWAISGQRTQSGGAMLMANPHLPWYGYASMYEAHLRSAQGLDFTGATFFGSPMLTIGHNENLGWTMTVNEPDVADAWRVVFDDPDEPLNYRYDGGYRLATEWSETIRVKTSRGLKDRTYTLRKTHHGPVVQKEDDQTYLVAQLAALKYGSKVGQSLAMAKATNLEEFRTALGRLNQMPIMNILYADREGNIQYTYHAIIPRRDDQFDWSKPVDGSDPRTEWQGIHTLDELPQVLNPPSGFVQNCNSTPFTTTDQGNPSREDFPSYMIEDRDDDKRRAKRSREMLREMQGVTLDELQVAALDTEIYWARHEIPKYAEHLATLKTAAIETSDAKLAAQVEPLLTHLLEWDCRVTFDSTEATLCEAWYELLYGTDYPGETLKADLVGKPKQQLAALVTAAKGLKRMHGDWRVPYGQIHRSQRHPNVADLLQVHFDDEAASLPNVGAHGPMGVMFTQYYTPSVNIPFVMTQRRRYGVVGSAYVGCYEFTPDGVRSTSVMPYGQSGDPASPHFQDQAKLLSASQFKPALFDWDDVAADAQRVYHPGE